MTLSRVVNDPDLAQALLRLAVWLRERFPDVAIMHVPAANPVAYY